MYSSDSNLKKDLVLHHIFSSWQFIQYTQKNIEIVEYCADVLKEIIDKMDKETDQWQQNLSSSFVEENTQEGKTIRTLKVTRQNLPTYNVNVVDKKVNPWFLFDKLIRDFFQYAMNSFDSMGQIANNGLLANKGKKVDSVDFQKMKDCFSQSTYIAAFPKMSSWFSFVSKDVDFKYIEAINNRTKHTADISNKLSMGFFGSPNTANIGSFFRKEVQHSRKNLIDQLNATVLFLNNAWTDFLSAFCDEFILDRFNENRMHEIGGVYQHSIKNDPTQDYSYAYINVVTDFISMPNEIFVLFVNEKEDEILSQNCPFENLLIRDTDGQTILGRYVADGDVGDDCLLTYRKYVKDSSISGAACFYNETKGNTRFYHGNPFFEITMVSNDDDLINRASLPF